jgi:dihydrodipicolinate synthase/N-acetylneuraminate lyase
MPQKLEGIFVPALVPLDDRGEINEPEFRRFLAWLIAQGAHGLYPNGSCSEFTRFSAEERRRIVKIACEEATGRVPVLAGAAEANVRETLAACETYAGYGARAVALVAPYYYKLGSDAVYTYFAEIARHTSIDVTLYNIPAFASPIDVATARRLAEFPRIIGIKDSTGDITVMMRLLASIRPQRPDFVFLTGWEAALVPMLMMGCDGGTHASSNAVPEITRRLFDLVRAGSLEEATALQYRLLELFDVMLYSFEFPDGFRMATELRGFRVGKGRQPVSAAQAAANPRLEAELRRILAGLGVQ